MWVGGCLHTVCYQPPGHCQSCTRNAHTTATNPRHPPTTVSLSLGTVVLSWTPGKAQASKRFRAIRLLGCWMCADACAATVMRRCHSVVPMGRHTVAGARWKNLPSQVDTTAELRCGCTHRPMPASCSPPEDPSHRSLEPLPELLRGRGWCHLQARVVLFNPGYHTAH